MSILFLPSIVSVTDRTILNLVVDPIKHSLGISDIQVGLLQGLAFGVFYAAVGVPLGLIADRGSRRLLIIAGISVWSLATIGGGLVQSFGGFFVSRLLVGLGEAALAPAAISLIADLFPPEKRGRPISLFLTGQAIASGIAVSVTSLIVASVAAGRFARIPVLAPLAAWRVAFVCCGAAGMPIVAALLTTSEPRRRSMTQSAGLREQIYEGGDYFLQNRRLFAPLYLGFAASFTAVYAAAAWAPTMLMRGFGATSLQIGQFLGPLSVLFGLIGPTVGGLLIDYHARRGNVGGKFKILTIAPLCMIPAALAVLAPTRLAAIILVASAGAVVAVIGTTMFATLQAVLPSNRHGVGVALTGLVNTILGATTGPLLVATVTQRILQNPNMVGYAIAIVVVPTLLLASLMFSLTAIAAKHAPSASVVGEVAWRS